MFIDQYLPAYQFGNRHDIRIHATPDAVWRALRTVGPRDIRFLRTLMAIRGLPGRLTRGRGRVRLDETPLLESFAQDGFVTLAEVHDELLLGTAGQFWKPAGGGDPGLSGPDDFLRFHDPRFAKAVVNFVVTPLGDGTSRLATETRVEAGGPPAHRAFALYWAVIRAGSAIIRLSLLRAVRRRAERS